ncbi:hypothetical protein KM043_013802 [Ampulex compressa]|nr:hypothetical protein KM043_013802 [Ampulex compressa]
MLIVLGEKVFEVIESSKNLIENEGFIPRNSSFPTDANIRDALSSILENTAFFGDIVLHLPDITHRILKAQKKWNATIHWSLNFANETKHFLDRDTKNMMHLVRQELNIVKRDPQYFNPYWTATMDLGKRGESSKRSKKSSKKSRQKKGPQMIKIDL